MRREQTRNRQCRRAPSRDRIVQARRWRSRRIVGAAHRGIAAPPAIAWACAPP